MWCKRFTVAVAMVVGSLSSLGATPWDKQYFPNVPLTTQDGESVRFFDDLIEGKIVVINFIYTTCPDTCPLETAQLVRVQQILSDRMGKDLFFYSITIDPENDTPSVLKEYKERFNAHWTFLTGRELDIVSLRKKLGLFIPEIQDGSSNHNVSMIIGNQTSGRWMKRSPFENPYVLADQIGNWLDGWKRPPQMDDYLNAPKLRDLPLGEQLFRTRCASCHTVTGNELKGALGPDLLGVTRQRETPWLMNWLRAPDQMLKEGDPIAVALFNKYNKLAMPNLRLNQEECSELIAFLERENLRLLGKPGALPRRFVRKSFSSGVGSQVRPVVSQDSSDSDVVAIMNAWVREARPGAKTNAGYLTLVNVGAKDAVLIGVECAAFEKVEIHEMARVDGLTRMRRLKELRIPAGGLVQLKPGGMHLMLIRAVERVVLGEKVEMTLKFKSKREQAVTIKVSDR